MESGVKDAIDFDQLVRIFVDTDVDTHFIVSLPRTSTIAELRELVKVTHRHCYPDNGDVDIGKLAVPGGGHGYHLADFLRIGQVYDRYEGKVFAEVEKHDPASSSGQMFFKQSSLSFKTSLTPKKVPLLEPQPFENRAVQAPINVSGLVHPLDSRVLVGEPGRQVAEEPWNELIVPKLQKEEDLTGDEICHLDSQDPLDRHPSRVNGLAVDLLRSAVGGDDGKSAERPNTAVCNDDDSDKINLGTSLASDLKGVRKRDSSAEINERPSKLRRLADPALDGKTLVEDNSFELKPDDEEAVFNDQKDLSASADSHIKPLMTTRTSSDEKGNRKIEDNDTVAGSGVEGNGVRGLVIDVEQKSDALLEDSGVPLARGKKKKEKKLESRQRETNVGIVSVVEGSYTDGLEAGGEQKPDTLPGESDVPPELGKRKKKKKRQLEQDRVGIDLDNGFGVEGSDINNLEVGRKEKSCELPEESGVPLNVGPKLNKKKGEQSKKKKKKRRKDEVTLEVSTSLNPDQKESYGQHELEKCLYVAGDGNPALAATGVQLAATPPSPNQSHHVDNYEEANVVDNIKVKKNSRLRKKGSTATAAVACDASSQMGYEDLARPSVLNISKEEMLGNRTSGREAEVAKEASGEGMIQTGPIAIGTAHIDDKVLSRKVNLFGDTNDVETSTSYQAGIEVLAQRQVAKVNSLESQETPNLSKPFSGTGPGRGAPSQAHSFECSGDVEGKGLETVNTKSCGSPGQSSQSTKHAKQESEGINLGSEVSGSWLRRVRGIASNFDAVSQQVIATRGDVAHSSSTTEESSAEREPRHVDELEFRKPDKVAHLRSACYERSAESEPRFADETETRDQEIENRHKNLVSAGGHMNHTPSRVNSRERHADISSKKVEDGGVNMKNDSVEFFSQDQSFQVAPAQVRMASSGSTTDDSEDESDTDPVEGTDELKKRKVGNASIAHKRVETSEESSDESGDSPTAGVKKSTPLIMRTPAPTVPGIRNNGVSHNFKRRASGVAAEIEAKFAQFIESQGGLDEIMGITLSQRKRSMPIESLSQDNLSGHGIESPANAPDSLLDLALNTQDSARNESMSVVGLEKYQAIDIAQASQTSAVKLGTTLFKVPKPVPIGTILGSAQGALRSAATAGQSSGRDPSKSNGPKDLRLKRKDPLKQNDATPLPTLDISKGTLLNDPYTTEGRLESAGNSSLLAPVEVQRRTFLNDLNAVATKQPSARKSSEKKNRVEGDYEGSQFMVVNNTDHISEDEREKKLEGKDATVGPSGKLDVDFHDDNDESLISPEKTDRKRKQRDVKIEYFEGGVEGTSGMLGLEISGTKKRKKVETGERKSKKKKFLAKELDGKELNILPENSVERSARETEELYFKLEKANRELWKQQEASSLKLDEEKTDLHDSSAAEVNEIEVGEGEDVAQSRLKGGEIEVGNTSNNKKKVVSDDAVRGEVKDDVHLNSALLAGSTEASDREDFVFQSQDANFETPKMLKHPDKSQPVPTDIFDFVSGDELPIKILSKSAKTSEKLKAKRMEELSDRAVQRVLQDEMLYVVDPSSVPGKKSRKDAKPQKWTVRMRGFSPTTPATPLHEVVAPSPIVTSKPVTDVGKVGGRVKQGSSAKAKKEKKPDEMAVCPIGCGKVYSGRTSAWYTHKRVCTGAPK